MDYISLITAIAGFITGIVTNAILPFFKQKQEYSISVNDQAVLFYKELLQKVEALMDDAIQDKEQMEKAYFELKEEYLKLKTSKKNPPA